MKTILNPKEAENILNMLPDKEKMRINNDKIRCGEYFIGHDHNTYYRVDPINVVFKEGKPVTIDPTDITII